MEKYDAIIIGVGQAGSPLANALIKVGYKVAVIEKDDVGGSCVNYGCTPTKTMIGSAAVAGIASRGNEFGINIPEINVNFDKVIERRNSLVNSSREKIAEFLSNTEGITFYKGTASFQNEHEINITGDNDIIISGDKIFINTGTSPKIPDIEGVNSVPYFTAKTIMELDKLPRHLIIIGGGYIGLEYAQMMKRLGSDVTIIEYQKQLLPEEDEDVASEIEKILQEDGIKIHTGADIQRVNYTNDELSLEIEDHHIKGTHLLIAAGTTPNSANLELKKARIKTDENGYIKVNDKLQTSQPHIYALGDVKGGPEFTHISYDDFRIVRDNLIHNKKRSTKGRPVPYCMFTDPELGRIGITEKEAKEKKMSYSVAKMDTKSVARAIEAGKPRGFYKVLVSTETDEIIGASIIAAEGGEISSMLQIAMMGNLKWQQLKDGVFSHPTYAESLNNLFAKLED